MTDVYTQSASTMVTALPVGLFLLSLPARGGAAPPRIQPEITVTASSGPVELSLSVLRTQLTVIERSELGYDWDRLAKDFPAEPPPSEVLKKYQVPRRVRAAEPVRFQLKIKNLGKRPFTVFSDLFWEHTDFRKALEEAQASKSGVFFVVKGPDGAPMKPREYVHLHACSGLDEIRNPYEGPPEDPKEEAETERLILRWKKEGHSIEKINTLLNERLREKAESERVSFARDHPRKTLRSGEWVATRAWAFDGLCHDEGAVPVGDFAELWPFDLERPGRYEIQAVYNEASASGNRQADVRFRTPPVIIEVKGS